MNARLGDALAITAIAGVAALGFVYGIDHDPDLTPTVTQRVTPQQHTLTEGHPSWNCLLMGNRTCGPDWRAMTPEQHDGISSRPDATCVTDDVTAIVCDDGTVFRFSATGDYLPQPSPGSVIAA